MKKISKKIKRKLRNRKKIKSVILIDLEFLYQSH